MSKKEAEVVKEVEEIEVKDEPETAGGGLGHLNSFLANQEKQEKACQAVISTVSIQKLESEHREELNALEEAIERKRNELWEKIETEHLIEKRTIEKKIMDVDHDLLTQQYKFQQLGDQLTAETGRAEGEYRQALTDHNKELDFLQTSQKTRIEAAYDKISDVQDEIQEIYKGIACIDGHLKTAQKVAVDAGEAKRIMTGVINNLRARMKESEAAFIAERKAMQDESTEQTDVLKEAIEAQEIDLEKQEKESLALDEPHKKRLTTLQTQIGHVTLNRGQIPYEKQNLKKELKKLKEEYRNERGNEDNQLEQLRAEKERKNQEGREKLLEQRSGFSAERVNLCDQMADISDKMLLLQTEADKSTELFQEKIRKKRLEIEAAWENHDNKISERRERRKKRLAELEVYAENRVKRRKMEIQLLEAKEDKLKQTFNIMKSHIQSTVDDCNQRIRDLLVDLNNPEDKQLIKLQEIEDKKLAIDQKREFINQLVTLAKEDAQREVCLIQDSWKDLEKESSDKLAQAEKDLQVLKQKDCDMDKDAEKQACLDEERFKKATDKLQLVTDKMAHYIDNLRPEVKRLEICRQTLLDLYKEHRKGVTDIMSNGEKYIEDERERLHNELAKEKEYFQQDMQQCEAAIEEARATRDGMTTDFKQEVGQFTMKAMGVGGASGGYNKMLENLEQKLEKYISQVKELNDEMENLVKHQKEEVNGNMKDRIEQVSLLQNKVRDMEGSGKARGRLMKEGNKLFVEYANDDHCMYCNDSTNFKVQKKQLANLHEDNRKLTAGLTNHFKKEKDYERLSSEALGQLRSCLQATDTADEEAIIQEEKQLKGKLKSLKKENEDLGKRTCARHNSHNKDHAHSNRK